MDCPKVEAALRDCLLTDDEMELGQKGWEAMEDPFKEFWEGSADLFEQGDPETTNGHPHPHPHTNGHSHTHTNGHH